MKKMTKKEYIEIIEDNIEWLKGEYWEYSTEEVIEELERMCEDRVPEGNEGAHESFSPYTYMSEEEIINLIEN